MWRASGLGAVSGGRGPGRFSQELAGGLLRELTDRTECARGGRDQFVSTLETSLFGAVIHSCTRSTATEVDPEEAYASGARDGFCKWLVFRWLLGGRDRDRTCDPLGVSPTRPTEGVRKARKSAKFQCSESQQESRKATKRRGGPTRSSTTTMCVI